MYPLKFEPFLRSMIWGGEKIAAYKGVETSVRSIGESWELSGVAGHESIVAEGPCKGVSLPELIDRYGAELVGKSNYERFGNEFPLLVKFIDAREDLSIQAAGDVFFLPAGRVHSIGAGAFIAEIQQTSDLTYRIYDYDRPGPDGKPRELHTELAKEAIDYTVPDDYRTHYERIRNKDTELVACPYFTTHLCDATFSVLCDYSALDSFVVLIFVAGAGELVDSEGNRVAVRQGETVLIPASTRQVTLLPGHGGLRFLSSYIETPEE